MIIMLGGLRAAFALPICNSAIRKDVTTMAWNPYTDQKNRAYQNILTTLFPEQTKTIPRIIVWSIIFLTDLILGIGGAAYYGLLQFDRFRTSNELMLVGGLLVLVIVGIFWLQGYIWYTIVRFFERRNQLD